jgi:hypothetical protein
MGFVSPQQALVVGVILSLAVAGLSVAVTGPAQAKQAGVDPGVSVEDRATAASGMPAIADVAASSNGSDAQWGGTENRTTAPAIDTEDIRVTYRVNRTPNDPDRVRVNYTAVIPEDVFTLRVILGDLRVPFTVEQSDGMEYDPATGVASASSQRGVTTTVSLSYVVESNVSRSFTSGLDTVETPDWAFVGSEQLSTRHTWQYFGSPPALSTTYEVDGEGYATGGYAFLGSVATVQRASNGQSFTLVVPDAAEPAVGVTAALDALENASNRLQVGDRDPAVTAFVVPDAIRRGGQASGSVFWVHQDSTLGADSVWYHEYTHTRQAWIDRDVDINASDDMEWLTEASADYYGGLLAWQTGTADADAFRAYVATDRYATEILQDADGDAKERKNYFKGRRVLAALDIRLQQHSGGTKTLADIIREMNSLSKNQMEYDDFRTAVTAVTNESTGNWLDTQLTTSSVPSIPADIRDAYVNPRSPLTVSLSPSTVPVGERTAVTVTVTNASGAPVEGATVESSGAGLVATTNATGETILAVNLSSTGN